jgi:hypothetical protein
VSSREDTRLRIALSIAFASRVVNSSKGVETASYDRALEHGGAERQAKMKIRANFSSFGLPFPERDILYDAPGAGFTSSGGRHRDDDDAVRVCRSVRRTRLA